MRSLLTVVNTVVQVFELQNLHVVKYGIYTVKYVAGSGQFVLGLNGNGMK